jgi:hypothetical protein
VAWAPDYITLAEAKAYAVDGTTGSDADIAVAITAASRSIDDYCNRQFGKVAAAEERFYTPWPDLDRGVWVVDTDDFMTTTGLVVKVDGDATIQFRKEPVNAAAESKPWTRITIDPATASIVPVGTDFEVSVTAVWGWTTVPVAVTAAARLQFNRINKRRLSPHGIAGSPELGTELRFLARVDPDVAVSLRGYVRPRAVA